MTGAELNKLRWALRMLTSGRTNDAREALEELADSVLSLKGPDAAAVPELQVIERRPRA